MKQLFRQPGRLAAGSVALLVLATGCSSPTASNPESGEVYQHLSAIQRCYLNFANTRNRAPASPEDLGPALRAIGYNADDVLRSPRDGRDFVIFWNTTPDYRLSGPLVLGYEATRHEGRRMVMTTMGVSEMEEAAFQAALFPPGQAAPPPGPHPTP